MLGDRAIATVSAHRDFFDYSLCLLNTLTYVLTGQFLVDTYLWQVYTMQ